MPKAEITSYSVVDLLSWQELGTLHVSPKFQRRSVWSTAAKGYFIDSVLLDYPIPPIHIRLETSKNGRTIREVIDGQQRMRAVFDFIAGNFRIPLAVSRDWGGKGYEQLDDDERDRLKLFSFTVYLYKKLTDVEVLDIFSRLNTYVVSLSAQELRNGKWFGQFKRVSYQLAVESLEFWRSHRIFTEQQIARMREAELVSELLVAQLDGLQDKKKSLDTFYENLDAGWTATTQWETGKSAQQRSQPAAPASLEATVSDFRATIHAIDDALSDVLQSSPLRRPALFHTLYCAVYHLRSGLPRAEGMPLRGVGMDSRTKAALRQVAGELGEVFDSKGRSHNERLRMFYEASTRQTDNLAPREARLSALLSLVAASR